jgi:hypothetical protein
MCIRGDGNGWQYMLFLILERRRYLILDKKYAPSLFNARMQGVKLK